MAQSEATATLPRPESSQLAPRHESAPPAVDAISGTTPEGQDTSESYSTQRNSNHLSTDSQASLNTASPLLTKSPKNTSPRLSVNKTPNLSNGDASPHVKPSLSSESNDSRTASGHVDSAPR